MSFRLQQKREREEYERRERERIELEKRPPKDQPIVEEEIEVEEVKEAYTRAPKEKKEVDEADSGFPLGKGKVRTNCLLCEQFGYFVIFY